MEYRKRFIVELSSKVRLSQIAPAFEDKHVVSLADLALNSCGAD